MAHLAVMLFFALLFVGCGAALQRLFGAYRAEVGSALSGGQVIRPAPREIRVTMRSSAASTMLAAA